MRNQHERRRIFESFPEIFSHPNTGINNPEYMCIGDGWLSLLEQFCIELTLLAKQMKLPDQDWPYFACIKEKFGGLRVYMNPNGFDETAQELAYKHLSAITQAAKVTCEVCGQKGHFRDGNVTGWLRVHCDTCEEKYLKKHAE